MTGRISIFLLLFGLAASGQTSSGEEHRMAQPAPVAEQPAHYTLGPGDQISLHVQDLDDVSEKPVRIDPSGVIDLPLVGRVNAAGLTIDQLREALTTKLSKYVESPRIAINVLEYHSQPVSVLGAVANPGIQQLQSPKRLLDVISVAGGLKQEAGSELTITRQLQWGMLPLPGAHTDQSGQFSIAQLSLDDLTKSRNPQNNIFVRPNDVISVPKAEIVYVLGQVKKSGGFALDNRNSISIIKALALAQGLDHDAAPKKARIVRGISSHSGMSSDKANPTEVAVNIQDILDGKAPDIQLNPDDVLFVPNSLARSATRRVTEAAIQIATGVVIFH